MTPDEEEAEILRNARAARDAGEITQQELNDTVYRIIAQARAEREYLNEKL